MGVEQEDQKELLYLGYVKLHALFLRDSPEAASVSRSSQLAAAVGDLSGSIQLSEFWVIWFPKIRYNNDRNKKKLLPRQYTFSFHFFSYISSSYFQVV